MLRLNPISLINPQHIVRLSPVLTPLTSLLSPLFSLMFSLSTLSHASLNRRLVRLLFVFPLTSLARAPSPRRRLSSLVLVLVCSSSSSVRLFVFLVCSRFILCSTTTFVRLFALHSSLNNVCSSSSSVRASSFVQR